MYYEITGQSTEVVDITLNPGETVRAETGAMVYMGNDVNMHTGISGGMIKGLKRKFAGEKFFMTSFTNDGKDKSYVGFGAYYPGKIIPLDMRMYDNKFYCQQRSFLCAQPEIDISIAFTRRIGAGLFGGEGFVLQKLIGDGLAFLHAGGAIVHKELLPGEILKVDTGCLLGFTGEIDYSISMISGIMNPLFAGEGFFLAKMVAWTSFYAKFAIFAAGR